MGMEKDVNTFTVFLLYGDCSATHTGRGEKAGGLLASFMSTSTCPPSFCSTKIEWETLRVRQGLGDRFQQVHFVSKRLVCEVERGEGEGCVESWVHDNYST